MSRAMNLNEKFSNLLPSSGTKKLALKGVTWLAGDKLLKLAVSVFTGALVARYLEPEKFGVFNALIAYAALFGPVANMGVNSIIMRDVAAHPEKEKQVVG